MNIAIRGNLRLLPSENRDTDHIQGTTVTDLLQVYNKKVRISGNLRLVNVMFSNSTRLLINEKPFTDDIANTFWLVQQPQVCLIQGDPLKPASLADKL